MSNLNEPKKISDLLAKYHALKDSELLYYLLSKLPTKQDSEDVLQDLFINISELDYSLLNNIKQPKHYLFQMAANAISAFYVSKGRREKTLIVGIENISDINCPNSSPETLLHNELQAEYVLQAISNMPEKRRQIFLLYSYRNLNRRQIAKELGMTVSAVDKNLVRAFAYCKDWLDGKE